MQQPVANPTGQHCLFYRAGGQVHALPLSAVIEVMRGMPVYPLAGAPPFVCGLCTIRGEAVAVIYVGLLVSRSATPRALLITVRIGSRVVALAAEAVLGIRVVAADEDGRLPPLLRDAASEAIDAIATRDGELLLFLRTAQLVPEAVFERLADAGGPA